MWTRLVRVEYALHLFEQLFENLQMLLHGASVGQRSGQVAVEIGEVGMEHDSCRLEDVLLLRPPSVGVKDEAQFGHCIDDANGIQFPSLFGVQKELWK